MESESAFFNQRFVLVVSQQMINDVRTLASRPLDCNTGMDIRVAVVEYQYIIYILFGMRIYRYFATGVGGRSVSITGSNLFHLRVEIFR